MLQELDKMVSQGRDYAGNSNKVLEYFEQQLESNKLEFTDYTGPQIVTDEQFVDDNLELDKERSIKYMKKILFKTRQDLNLSADRKYEFFDQGEIKWDIENMEMTPDHKRPDNKYDELMGIHDEDKDDQGGLYDAGLLGIDGFNQTYPGVEMPAKDKRYFEVDTAKEYIRLANRHRLDLAKLLFEKDGGYTLREFKEIYKKEIKENPELYYLNKPDDQDVYEFTYGYKDEEDWSKNPLNYDMIIMNKNLNKEKYEELAA